jgi:hypothetical protein
MSARQYGKLPIARWRDTENWTNLTADAQWLYDYLASQPTTDGAGIFPIQISKWAKGAADMDVERVKAAANLLVEHRRIIVDHDTEEGLLRTYIRDDQAGDNIFKGQLNCALQAQSQMLRAVLLSEIRQLDRKFKDGELERIDALESSIPSDLVRRSATSPSPSTATTTQPFEPPSNTVATPSERRSNAVAVQPNHNGAGDHQRACACGRGYFVVDGRQCAVCLGEQEITRRQA